MDTPLSFHGPLKKATENSILNDSLLVLLSDDCDCSVENKLLLQPLEGARPIALP